MEKIWKINLIAIIFILILVGTVNATWWNTSYGYRKQINIQGGISTLSNFTVLINVSFLTGKMQATFTDLRFVSGSCNTSSQDTLLSYEFDKVVNSNGVYVWVKIPSLTTGTNSICMYYNNPSADSGQDPLNTWDKNYMGVYHFTEGTGSTTTDSTGHKNGTLGVGVSWNTSSGFIGNAVQMGGDNTNYINLSDNTFLKWQHPPVTFESLLTAATDGAYMGIVGNDHPATEWYWARGPDQMRYGNDVGGWLISNEEPINIKRYTAFSYANNDMHIKIDSQESIQAVTSTLGPATGSIYIGYSPGLAGGTGSWSGTLDEVRISNISRNQAWINRSQMNWNGTLFTFDGEEKGPTAPPTVNLSIPIDYYNSTSTTVIFNCSAVDETPILNLTLVINDIDNSTIVNATAGQNLSLQVSKVMNNGNYNWSCKSSNLAGSEGLSVNRTLTVDTFPSAILNTPANGSIKNTPQNYTANLTDGTGLLNATLYIYNSTDDLVNETTTSFGVGTLTTIVGVVVSLVDGVYHWFYQVFDTFGQSTISSVNNTITIDTISPIISIVYPLNGTHYSKDIIEINYTIYDVSIGSCWYSIDNGVTNTTITCGNNITGVNASVSGTYNWSVWANDTNNTITEALTTFIIDKESPTITWYNPTTGSHPIVKTAFILNVSIFDSYLDAVNVSVINITGDYIYTNLTEGIIDTLFWVNYTIPLNEGNNTVEICARDSLTGSPEIQAKAIFTKVDETKTTFDSSISRTLQIYDSKDILLSTRDYNLNTTDIWVDGGKHYKTTWEMINIPKDSYIKIILTNEKGRMDLLTDRGITRIVDSDRKYYWRFDDMEKAGFEVKYEQDHNNVNVIVKQGSYVPITKDLTSKFILDPITGGLNTKCENETIIYDTTPPYVNITYPINKTYKTDVTAINYTYSDINMAYCWYSTDNGVTNNTVVCGTNVTGLTSNQGSNTWIVGVNDTVGNLNQSKITFFKDTIIPIINLTYPINKTYDKVITEINFTYIETNVGTCWYSTDGGIINMSSKSLSWCYQESANVSTACGGLDTGVYYGITANWVNPQLVIDGDWSTKGDGPAGYVENISVNYTKPTNATAALWQYKSRYDPPTNITIPSSCFNYYTDVIDLMIQSECIGTPLCHDYAKFYCRNASGLSLIKTSSMGGWIYEEAINWEVTQDETSKCLNITNLYSSEGSNNWLIGINDTLGNENMSAVTFYVDSLKPSISIFSPVNNTNQSDAGMDINYSVVDVHLDSCWYSNDTFTLNTTLSGCSNITTISWSEGQHNITIWANDTYGHTGSASVRFYIDTTYPLIEFGIGTPVNYANMSQNSIYINTSWSDDYYANVTFNLYNSNHALTSSTTYTDLTKFHNFTGISEGYYYYNVTITDAVNHKNSTTTRKILLDITGPSASVGYTDSGSYSVGTNNSYTNKSAVNFTTNVTDVYGIKNITITIKNSTGDVINKTTQTFTDTVLYYLFGVPLTLIDGVYNWIVEAWDNSFNQIRTYTPPTDTSPNNLIAYWKFDETSGTTAVDSVAGKYNFTVGNSTSWVAGKRGNAYLCNDTDFINTTYVPAGLTEFSINIWIKRSGSWVGNHWLLSNRDGDGSFIIETSGSGITSKLFGDGGVPGSGTTATPDASLNTWEMFTITFNSTGSSVYMNGSYIDTKAWTISSGLNESANIFFLSAQDGTTPFVNAIFDEMAFWNKSLTSTEVSNMYDVASPALTITVDTTPGIVTSQNTTSTQYDNDVTIYKLNASITELNINSTGVEFEGTNFSITNTTTTHYEYNFSKNLTYVPYKSPFYFWVKDLAGLYTISSTYYFNVLCPNDRSLLTNTSNGFCMEKIEFTGNQNITRYINISTSLAAITSAYINLSGFNSSNVLWPYNVSLRVGDIYVWNYTGNFTHANNKTTDFASAINKYMNSTYVIGSNYVIPITFNSGTKGVIEYNVVTITSDNILENNVSYNNPVYETAREYYYINLTYDSSAYTSILGTLYYNDIAYTGTKTGTGSNVQFAASLDIPANLANRTFYWRIALTNSSSTYYTYTANRTQNITTVIFSICNATHNVTYLNFTFLDESAITIKLNATNDLSDFDFWLGNGTTTKNYIYQNTSLNWEYDFCMTPSDKTITAALFFKYANVGQGYPLRTYQTASITLTNVSTKKTLYLLGTSSGAIYSSIRTAAISGAAISGVTITYERQIGGVWTLIGEEVTGDDGIATFWVDPNYQYRFTATKSGYTTVQVTIQPAESQYTIVMTTGTSDTFTSDISGIKWEIDPGIGELQPKSNQKFNATVYASKGNLESCKLELINATNLSQALASDTSVSNGTYCFTDLTYTTVKGVRYFGKLSLDTTNSTGYFVVDSDFMWVIWDIKNGSSNLKFTSLFNDIRSISDFGTGTEGEFGRLVMFFLIMTMIIGVFTFFSGVELSNPGVSIILIWVIVFFASVGGFFTYTSGASNLTAGTTTWFATYGLLIVYTILTAGYIFSLFRRTATQ